MTARGARIHVDDREIQRRLARLADRRRVELVAKKAVRAALKPVLPQVKAATPVDTGALQKSLSVQISGGDRVTGYIWPRKEFSVGRGPSGIRVSRKNPSAAIEHPLDYISQVERRQPFIAPTVDRMRPTIDTTLRTSLASQLATA